MKLSEAIPLKNVGDKFKFIDPRIQSVERTNKGHFWVYNGRQLTIDEAIEFGSKKGEIIPAEPR